MQRHMLESFQQREDSNFHCDVFNFLFVSSSATSFGILRATTIVRDHPCTYYVIKIWGFLIEIIESCMYIYRTIFTELALSCQGAKYDHILLSSSLA